MAMVLEFSFSGFQFYLAFTTGGGRDDVIFYTMAGTVFFVFAVKDLDDLIWERRGK